MGRSKKNTLQKSWKKVCPSLTQAPETPDTPESDTAQLVRDLQSIQSDIQSSDVEEWLADGDGTSVTNEDLADEQIIDLVVQQAIEEESDEDEKEEDEKISHSAAKDAFETALKYLEQQSTATAMDVMWAKKWRDAAAKSRFKKLKQKNVSDFFK